MVNIGSWVTVSDGSDEESYRIVPQEESNPLKLAISELSPLAQALLGHHPGDVVEVCAPGLRRRVTLVAVTDQG
jgi:transcription elongation factor GreA